MEKKYGLLYALNKTPHQIIGLSSTPEYRDSMINDEISRLFQMGYDWDEATKMVAEFCKPVTCEVRIIEE